MRDLFATLDNLLDCAESEIETPVCRRFIYPGERPPLDICEVTRDGADGQLWISNPATFVGWPDQSGLPMTCAVPRSESISLGIVRCQRGSIQDGGQLPDENLITEDAERQQNDKDALLRALLCCSQIEGQDIMIESWEPIAPNGKCVGGRWTFSIRIDGCVCSQES